MSYLVEIRVYSFNQYPNLIISYHKYGCISLADRIKNLHLNEIKLDESKFNYFFQVNLTKGFIGVKTILNPITFRYVFYQRGRHVGIIREIISQLFTIIKQISSGSVSSTVWIRSLDDDDNLISWWLRNRNVVRGQMWIPLNVRHIHNNICRLHMFKVGQTSKGLNIQRVHSSEANQNNSSCIPSLTIGSFPLLHGAAEYILPRQDCYLQRSIVLISLSVIQVIPFCHQAFMHGIITIIMLIITIIITLIM